ncbi:cupin domain-containing protein [Chitinibacter tainanensis]|uniref:cupin domain-containing protein n=1 Tax=Chitinibacter tainanensis TaxID=230667 RepID=UPI0023538AD3|nr:cupin domain-containing protein [Chitinibacter tainanensis]
MLNNQIPTTNNPSPDPSHPSPQPACPTPASLSGNLFAAATPPASGELFSVLLERPDLLIERIVSSDQLSPTLYCQTQDEWVVLLQGEASVQLGAERVQLQAGDYLFIPAQTPHQVLATSAGALWLAIHHGPRGAA